MDYNWSLLSDRAVWSRNHSRSCCHKLDQVWLGGLSRTKSGSSVIDRPEVASRGKMKDDIRGLQEQLQEAWLFLDKTKYQNSHSRYIPTIPRSCVAFFHPQRCCLCWSMLLPNYRGKKQLTHSIYSSGIAAQNKGGNGGNHGGGGRVRYSFHHLHVFASCSLP